MSTSEQPSQQKTYSIILDGVEYRSNTPMTIGGRAAFSVWVPGYGDLRSDTPIFAQEIRS